MWSDTRIESRGILESYLHRRVIVLMVSLLTLHAGYSMGMTSCDLLIKQIALALNCIDLPRYSCSRNVDLPPGPTVFKYSAH
jgi:hypothetical protein